MPFSSYQNNQQPFSSYQSNQHSYSSYQNSQQPHLSYQNTQHSYSPYQNNQQPYSSNQHNQQQYSSSHYQSNSGTLPDELPYIITDPKSYIRAYATQTPAYTVMDSPRDAYQAVNNNYDNSERRIPIHNINKSYQFIKDLRDQSTYIFVLSLSVVVQSGHLGRDQIDSLIRDMEWKLKTGIGAVFSFS
ncbi:hypothetical protein X798_05821 [Onchocerca flexuosa]|uniref:Uncharacterized protein n=1 Tax=Onchocerca flexuosa TaxID=387005 RepID=A0A238BR97_9BILA|nr:hypothetical protein X798_05821 [Onchocerca flexuosa]